MFLILAVAILSSGITTTSGSSGILNLSSRPKVSSALALSLSGTPAGRFLDSLAQEIGSEEREAKRFRSCFGGRGSSLGGAQPGDCMLADENGIVPASGGRNWTEFFFYPSGHPLTGLGTQPGCFPLMLAGAAVEDWGVVVEVGPFVGQSSRCIAMGLNATGDGKGGRYHVYDSFHGFNNAVRPAMKDAGFTDLQEDQVSDWEWFWRLSVNDVYPSTLSTVGYAGPDSLRPEKWDHQSVALLSVDSIKDVNKHWIQVKGLQPMFMERGSIISFLDGFQVRAGAGG